MKTQHTLGLAALVAAAAFAAAMPKQDKPASSQDHAAMMQAWKDANKPGEQHKAFADCEGSWKTHFKHWMDPNSPAAESDGTSTFESILGGRYLVENARGDGPMGPFEGMGITAYNNVTGEYEHVWLDDMSTGLLVTRGTEGPNDTLALRGEMVDPTTKAKSPVRVVATTVSENEKRIEMYCNQHGKEQKSMEITYTRGGTP
jgi:hypothetical protein